VIRFRAFGSPDLRGDEASELRAVLTQPRLLALLAYLALARPRTFQRRDLLVALFWPELNTEQARNALRQAVHRLRRALGEGVLVGRGAEELGLDAARFWSDVGALEEALEAGCLEEALDLYRGDLLPGFHVSDAPEFERWLDEERDRLRRRAVGAAWSLADRSVAAGETTAAAHWARVAAALTPDDEGAVQRLIRTLAQAGDRSGALRAYETFAQRLADDVGAEPAPETRALAATLKAAPVPPAPVPASVEAVRRPAGPGPDALVPPPPVAGSAAHPRRIRGRVMIPSGVIALAGLAAVIALVRRGSREEAPPAARSIAVFPFGVRGGADLAYLGEAMVDLLSAKLEGAADLHPIDPRSVIGARAGQDPGLAAREANARAARALGASGYIVGDVVEIAGRLEISGALFDLDGGPRPVTTASVSGETTALFDLVDDLAGRILAGMPAGRDTTLTRLAALTTHSLPALKAYLRGEQQMRAGRDGEAAAAFREALAFDTSFALAQYRLALTATWVNVGDADDPNALIEKAAGHTERLSPLVRDLLSAYRAYRRFDADDAERRYRVLIDGHPQNVEAWLMLGETLFHFNGPRGRSPLEAWPAFERVLALEPANPHAMIHQARLAARHGRTAALDSLVERYLTVHRDAGRVLEMRALRAFTRGGSAQQRDIAGAVAEVGEVAAVVIFQDALLYAHSPDAARRLAPVVTRPSGILSVELARQRALLDLPLVEGRLGRDPAGPRAESPDDDVWRMETQALLLSDPVYPVARARVAALRDSVKRREPYAAPAVRTTPEREHGPEVRAYLLGLLSVRLGDTAAAAAQLAVLGGVREPERTEVARALAHALRAEMRRASGDVAGALRELEQFAFVPTWQLAHWGIRERFLRAELLRALGREAEALSWYDSFTGAFDTPWLAAAHLRSGEVHERLGNRDRAAFHYGRFVQMWKACDPELRPLVTRAEEALGRIAPSRD
jgi:DNA-binding SARP family transcriptional activator